MEEILSPAASPFPGADPVTWGPSIRLRIVAGVVLLGAVVWLALDRGPEDRLVAAVLAVVAVLSLAALFRLRRRLTAGPQGVVVTELFRSIPIGWGQVRGISAPTRGRFGLRNPTIEVDLADDGMFIFGRFDLGTDPGPIYQHLKRLRAASAS